MAVDIIAGVIARAQDHDPGAFDILIEEYGTRLYGYFYRQTGNREDAEDLLQDMFVRLVRGIDDYRHEGRFDAWLFCIATNLVRDRSRQTKRRGITYVPESARGGDDTDGLADYPDSAGIDPAEPLDRAEQVDRLQWAIGQLPDAEREVILLRHFSGLNFREVAEVMDTPLGTALARAHRGLAKLRELMVTADE